MLSILSDTQKAVVKTVTMRYLKNAGFEMSKPTYYRHRRKIESLKYGRMKFIALHFQEQHIERIDKIE